MQEDEIAVLARVAGRVQGVGFRAWAKDEAVVRGLAGWVRNEPDGSVKALIVGSEDAVTAMLEALKKGPPGAAVSGVVPERVEPDERPTRFSITG